MVKCHYILKEKGTLEMKKHFEIHDWAGNILNYKGYFERPCFAVPMEFNTLDDAWEYMDSSIPEDSDCEPVLIEHIGIGTETDTENMFRSVEEF